MDLSSTKADHALAQHSDKTLHVQYEQGNARQKPAAYLVPGFLQVNAVASAVVVQCNIFLAESLPGVQVDVQAPC